MRVFGTLAAIALLVGCTPKVEKPAEPVEASKSEPAARPLPSSIDEAVASPFRSSDNVKRDIYRHPAETLKFFGLTPEMTVLEISPGKGWYAEILIPLLSSKGQYIAGITPDGGNEYLKSMNEGFSTWLSQQPELKAKTVDFSAGAPIAVEAPVDMIVTFRNVHNWMGQGKEKETFAAFFKALKPGGILGVVEHRGAAKKKQDPKGKSGYVREADVIKWAEKAGFKMEEKSEVNANPKDTKDYKDGVWTLPPTLKLGDKDREKYLAIGESDRMTLRFVKPAPKAK